MSNTSPSLEELQQILEPTALDADLTDETTGAIKSVIARLSDGSLRVCDPITVADGSRDWRVNKWVKKAVLMYFRIQPMRTMRAGDLEFHDKIGIQGDWAEKNVRVVPHAVVREGAHVAPGAILMPSYINIGAYVDTGTMIDTWSTVGSCAQIGKNCHISGGVGIGGVLEPLQAAPVIIEDDVFIGARGEVAEGVRVRRGAVLAMGCYLGASTRVYNAITKETFIASDGVPEYAVCVPGSLPSRDGTHETYAVIIKKIRDEKTNARTALNDILR